LFSSKEEEKEDQPFYVSVDSNHQCQSTEEEEEEEEEEDL